MMHVFHRICVIIFENLRLSIFVGTMVVCRYHGECSEVLKLFTITNVLIYSNNLKHEKPYNFIECITQNKTNDPDIN